MLDQSEILNRDGFIWIHDNIVSVSDPEEGGIPATITPCDGVQMVVNGHPVGRMILATSKDHIELKSQIIEEPARIDITMDEDEMNAWLECHRAVTYLYRVRDQLPANNLQICADRYEMPAKTLPLASMMEKISAAGINHGIDHAVLRELQKNSQDGKYLIASGIPAIDPVDDEVEIDRTWDDPITRKTIEDEDGRINHWETAEYPIAKVGDTLAFVKRGYEGVDGMTVKGVAVKTRQPVRVEILSNHSTRIDEDGRIVARKKGRPRFAGTANRWNITIADQLDIPYVSMKTGNVHYVGNVLVQGNIEDTMMVNASGDIIVKGSVNFAHISSCDSVQIAGGLLSGTLSAGVKNDMIGFIENDLRSIQQQLSGLTSELQEVVRTQLLTVPDAISHLLNTKHTDLSKWMIAFIRNLRGGKIGYSADLAQEVMTLFQPLLGDCSDIRKVSDLQDITDRVAEIFQQEVRQDPKGDVLVSYVLNSRIDALGNVRVTGNGCTNSVISCGGDLLVLNHFRGGEASAGKRIIIASAGSHMGARTLLKVPVNGSVTLFRVYPDTEVRIGRRSISFMKERVNVHIFLDAKGEIATRTADRRELTDK